MNVSDLTLLDAIGPFVYAAPAVGYFWGCDCCEEQGFATRLVVAHVENQSVVGTVNVKSLVTAYTTAGEPIWTYEVPAHGGTGHPPRVTGVAVAASGIYVSYDFVHPSPAAEFGGPNYFYGSPVEHAYLEDFTTGTPSGGVMKLDADGELQWDVEFPAKHPSYYSSALATAGDYLRVAANTPVAVYAPVGGDATDDQIIVAGQRGNDDKWLRILNPDGDYIGQHNVATGAPNRPRHRMRVSPEGVIVFSAPHHNGADKIPPYLWATNLDGDNLWPTVSTTRGYYFDLDSSDNQVILGPIETSGTIAFQVLGRRLLPVLPDEPASTDWSLNFNDFNTGTTTTHNPASRIYDAAVLGGFVYFGARTAVFWDTNDPQLDPSEGHEHLFVATRTVGFPSRQLRVDGGIGKMLAVEPDSLYFTRNHAAGGAQPEKFGSLDTDTGDVNWEVTVPPEETPDNKKAIVALHYGTVEIPQNN